MWQADCTMAELVHMLHHEEAGMTVDRSLEGAPTDVLSFEVHRYLSHPSRPLLSSVSEPI
jgi:hypothetical protein